METKERICRLCLKVNDTSTAIEGEVKDILNKFLPKVVSGSIENIDRKFM